MSLGVWEDSALGAAVSQVDSIEAGGARAAASWLKQLLESGPCHFWD